MKISLEHTDRVLQQLHRAMDSGLLREAIEFEWAEAECSKVGRCHFVKAHIDSASRFYLHYELHLQGAEGQFERNWYAQIDENPENFLESLKAPLVPMFIPLSSLGLLLRPVGVDEKIVGLDLLHRPDQALSCLNTFFGAGKIEAVQSELLTHRLGDYAVIRFLGLINGHWRSLIGRAYSNEGAKAWQAYELMQSVWANSSLDAGFGIPEPVAYLPEYQMILMQDFPDALAGSDSFSEQFYRNAGDLLRLLHQHADTGSAQRSDLCGFHWASYIGGIIPSLGRLAFEVGEKCQKELASIEQIQGQTIHGHYDLNVLLNSDNRAVLLDLARLHKGDVAQDLGYFLASAQSVRIQKGAPDSGSSWAFLSGYRNVDDTMRGRIVAYQRAALFELAYRFSLWPEKRRYCEALLQTALS